MPDATKKVPSGDKTPDFTRCPHWGKGGRYLADADGNRTPVLAPEPNAAGEPQSGCTGEAMQAVEGGVLESTPAAPDRAIPDPATSHAHRTPRKPR
jgi:hypothetical protein